MHHSRCELSIAAVVGCCNYEIVFGVFVLEYMHFSEQLTGVSASRVKSPFVNKKSRSPHYCCLGRRFTPMRLKPDTWPRNGTEDIYHIGVLEWTMRCRGLSCRGISTVTGVSSQLGSSITSQREQKSYG